MENYDSLLVSNVNYADVRPKYKMGSLIGFDKVIDEEAVKNSLKNLFSITRGQVPGKPWLGNPLDVFLFDNISEFEKEAIKDAFVNIIEKYEPRVKIEDLEVFSEEEYNSVTVKLYYRILIGDVNTIRNYRFSLNYNNLTNISLREIT